MRIDGIEVVEGSKVTNLTVASGDSYPSNPNVGELFFRTDQDQLYNYKSTGWAPVGSGGGGGSHAITGDVSGTIDGGTDQLTLATVNASAGSYGSNAVSVSLQVNSKGLVTSVSSTPIQITEGAITDGSLLARVADAETISGAWTFSANPTISNGAASRLFIDGNTSTVRGIQFQTGGTNRWLMGVNSTVESGLSAGSDFFIGNYNDTGGGIGIPFTIARATGAATFTGAVTAASFTTAGAFTGSGSGLTNIPNSATTATTAQTPNTIVLRDGSGAASVIASSAVQLATSRNFTVTGDATSSATSFNGTSDVSLAVALANVNASPVTDSFHKITVNSKGLVTATSAVTASDITSLVDSTYVNVAGDTMTGSLISSAIGTAFGSADNLSGVGTKLTIQAGLGSSSITAGATGGHGHVEIIGGGSTTSWTVFSGLQNRARRGGVLIKAGVAPLNSGSYVQGSSIEILGTNGTNDGTNFGIGSRIYLAAGGSVGTSVTSTGATLVMGGASGTTSSGGVGGFATLSGGQGQVGSTLTTPASLTLGGGSSNGTGGDVSLVSGGGATGTGTTGGAITISSGAGDGVSTPAGDISINSGGTAVVKILGSTAFVGIGTIAPASKLHVVGDGAANALRVDTYSNDNLSPGLMSRKARGSATNPSAVQADDILGGIIAMGYGTTAFGPNNTVAITGYAASVFTDASQPTYIRFDTTATGSLTRVERARIDQGGVFYIGTTTQTDGSLLNVNGTVSASTPTLNTHLTTKAYVDAQLVSASSGPTVVVVAGLTQTAVTGAHYVMTGTGGASVLTFPASPAVGTLIWVSNYTGRTDLVIDRNGNNFMGAAENFFFDADQKTVQFRYINSTLGWIPL